MTATIHNIRNKTISFEQASGTTGAGSTGQRGPSMNSGRSLFSDVGFSNATPSFSAATVGGDGTSLFARAGEVIKGFFNALIGRGENTNARMQWEIQKLKNEFPKIESQIVDAITAEKLAGQKVTRLEGEIEKLKSQGRQAQGAGREDLVASVKRDGALKVGELEEAKADFATAQGDRAQAEKALGAAKQRLEESIKTLQRAVTQAKRGDQKEGLAKTLADAEAYGTGTVAQMVERANERATRGQVALDRQMENSGAMRDFDLKQIAMKEAADKFTF